MQARMIGIGIICQGLAAPRAAAFAGRLVIMDAPMAALGVTESAEVRSLIRAIRDGGPPVSHNMSHVVEVADRIHIQRLGRRVALTSPGERTMSEVVGMVTGAFLVPEAA